MIYLILNSGFKDNNPDETIKMLKIVVPEKKYARVLRVVASAR